MSKKTVLFVGDESEILKPVTRAMKEDFDVLTVSDGSSAWEVIKLFQIDYMVADMQMMSGLDLLEKMQYAGRKIITIAASGGDDSPIKKRWNEFGVSAYIAKPYTASNLKKMINSTKWQQKTILV
jgi:DNA-binding NtrC family response regulator